MMSTFRRITAPVLLGALMAAGIAVLWSGLPMRRGNPLDSVFRYSYPKAALSGTGGALWVLDKAWIIGADGTGKLWAANNVTDSDEDTTGREESLSLDSDGRFGPVLDARDYDKATRSNFYNVMTFLQYHDGQIFYFYPLAGGTSELTDIDTMTGSISRKTPPLDCLAYKSMMLGADGVLYLLDTRTASSMSCLTKAGDRRPKERRRPGTA